jgi:ATP-binding cassette subfamily B (MDR/TAP) protein 1
MITKFGDDNNLFFLFWEICSQVGKFIQCVSCLLGGLVVAFIKGWLLALVLLSSIPLLLLSGSIMSFVFAMMASREQAAYSEAATIVERIIGSIRTVCMPTPSIKNLPLFFSFHVSNYGYTTNYSNVRRLHHLPAKSKL